MGFLDGLRSLFAGGSAADGGYYIYVRCNRCKEAIRTRINLRNDLSARDEGGYRVTKTLVGSSGRCFQRIEVTLVFDATHRVVDQQIVGGEFITEKDYQAAQPSSS
jgi:hypothetical protein